MSIFSSKLMETLYRAGYDNELAICKVFAPWGSATWIIFGCDPAEPNILSCVADLGFNCVEAGSVSISELESLLFMNILPLELDKFFVPGKSMEYYLTMDTLVGVS